MGEEVIGASSWRKMLRAGWERSPRWLSATPGEIETNENTDRSDGRIGTRIARMGGLGIWGDWENAVHELKTRIHEWSRPETSIPMGYSIKSERWMSFGSSETFQHGGGQEG